MKKKKGICYSGIGGQAVLEGIMMKNREVYSIAVRRPDGEIEVHLSTHDGMGNKKLRSLPIVRGVVNFVDSLVLGMKCLTFSASFYDEEEAKPSKADELFQKVFKDNIVGRFSLCFVHFCKYPDE